jgi:hypothetical protein
MMRGGGGGDMKRLKQVHDCRETGLSTNAADLPLQIKLLLLLLLTL